VRGGGGSPKSQDAPPIAGLSGRECRVWRVPGVSLSLTPPGEGREERLHGLDDAARVRELLLGFLDRDLGGVQSRLLRVVTADPQ
jgi:hypothetical protein